jgi:group I intron endonuclease
VGSAVNLSKRFARYYNIKQISKDNMSINKALLKYGFSGFQLEILEYCEPKYTIEREQYYMNLLVPEYNILKFAGSRLGYKHTEETLAKLRGRTFKLSEETKTRMSKAALGRKSRKGHKHSEETKAKISAAVGASRLGCKHSEETRIKIGASMGTSVKVNTETGITTIYPSKRQVARELNTSLDTVRRYIISSKPFKGRYLIENLIES